MARQHGHDQLPFHLGAPRRGKVFYGCNRYPECTFASWDRPVARDCPACGARVLVERVTKRQGTLHSCLNPDCGFKEQVE